MFVSDTGYECIGPPLRRQLLIRSYHAEFLGETNVELWSATYPRDRFPRKLPCRRRIGST